MKRLLLLAFLLPSFGCLYAQTYDPSKVDKRALALHQQAMERAEDGNLALSAGLLKQAIDTDPNYLEAYLSLAWVYGQLKNYKTSVDYYEKAFSQDSVYTLEYKSLYSISLAGMGQFEKALDAINELLQKKPPRNSTSLQNAEYRKQCYEFAVNYANTHRDSSYIFAPQNMGSGINTSESEYWPSLTIDGQELVFTRKLKNVNEDFFSSQREGNVWGPANAMPGTINTPQNEAAQNISLDGEWLVFTANNRPDGFGNFDIYISYRTTSGWSEGENLGPLVNSDQWESQPSLSPDKRDLYFASSRPGGFGGIDIYVSHLQPNGKWGRPENLGPGINTPGNEQCPFIHADNQTLYFTSNYWPGYGDEDLFFTRKVSINEWSKPVNLGYPINTISKEGTIFITANGKTAYYASDRSDTRGGLDIYSFELREDVRPYRTGWVKGRVFDKKTNEGIPSQVELTDLTSRLTISRLQTDEQGNYLLTLPVGKDYAFNVNKKGYLFYSDKFLLTNGAPDSIYEKNIALQPIEMNATMVLNNIYFPVNKFDLEPSSQVELDKIVQFLNENPAVKILISGHTDNAGKPADNLTLSNNRAKTVVSYLINKRIHPERLTYKGFGETKPLATNKTEVGRAQNRRTELKIVAQ